MRWLVLAALAATAAPAVGQAPPNSDVYLVSFTGSGAGLRFGTPVNLTRRAGFDNQPYFTPDGRSLYYTSVREGGPKGTTQADIYRIDLKTKTAVAMTRTPESEYSATPMPGGREVAVIRVEVDSTQRLWAFPAEGNGDPRLLLERIKPVGYQAWLDAGAVGVFVLGSPPTLQVADLATGTARVLLPSIGRSLHRIPGRRTISVNHQVADSLWSIVEVDPVSAARTHLAPMPAGSDFYAWLPDRTLLASSGGSLYWTRPGPAAAWTRVATFDGFTSITRLAVSPDGKSLAFVAEDGHP